MVKTALIGTTRDAKCRDCHIVFTIAYYFDGRKYECPLCEGTDIAISKYHSGQDFGPGDEWKEGVHG